jgi:hypothetical protein
MAVVTRDRVAPDELHVLVPAAPADRVRAALLKAGSASSLTAVCRRLGIARNDIMCGLRTFHGLGASGKHASAPSLLADEVLDVLRSVSADASNEITLVAVPDAGAVGIVALSGLQLVGRPRDRFFVLEFESRRKPRRPTLLELPLLLAERPLPSGQRYQDVAASRRLARLRLSEPGVFVLNAEQRIFMIGDLKVKVPRLQFFWMFCFATLAPHPFPLRLLNDNFHVDGHGDIVITPGHPDRIKIETVVAHLKSIFVTLFPESADEFALVLKRACGAAPGLPSVIAKLNANLKQALGIAATPYLVAGLRGSAGYRLTLPSHRIRLEPQVSTAHGRRHHD